MEENKFWEEAPARILVEDEVAKAESLSESGFKVGVMCSSRRISRLGKTALLAGK